MTDYEGEERREINGDLARLVTEAGAKLSILEDARTEMKGLKESVVVLADAISHTVTAEEVEAASRRSRIQLGTVILLTGMIIAVLGGLLLHGQALGRQGTRCVAFTMFEHRVANQASHDAVFNQFHIPLPEHRALPPEPTESQIAQACAPFLPEGY